MKLVVFWKQRAFNTVSVFRFSTNFVVAVFTWISMARDFSNYFISEFCFLARMYSPAIWDFCAAKPSTGGRCVCVPCAIWSEVRNAPVRYTFKRAHQKSMQRNSQECCIYYDISATSHRKVFQRKLTGSHIFVCVLFQFSSRRLFFAFGFHLQCAIQFRVIFAS